MSLPAITRSLNKLNLVGRLNAEAIPTVVETLRSAEAAGFNDFVFDFSECSGAYANGTVPLVAIVDAWQSNGSDFDLIPPRDATVSRLIQNTGFAHLIAPKRFPWTGSHSAKNIPIQRFTSLRDQVTLVRSFMDILLQSTSLTRDVLQGLEWSLNEVVDNVLNHANTPRGGFACLTTMADKITFTVADSGIGVLASLKEGHPYLRNDTQALGEAIKAGVTRNKEAGQGNGLAGTLRIATASGGSFSICSGIGRLNVFHDTKTSQLASLRKVLSIAQRYSGTIVDAQIRKNPTFKVSEALGFTGMIGGVLDVIDAKYESETSDEFMLKLAGETTGFGSREAGRQIRTKCVNLLNADMARPLVLDWSGVPVISSSFADEAVGKLFVEMGPLSFSSRIKNIGLEPLVRGLIEKAILQRASQASARFTVGNQALDNIQAATEEQHPE